MKKKIVTSVMSLVMCASLVTGATYALFTSESKTNIAITSGKVEVVATIETLAVHSPTAIAEDGTITDDTNAAADGVFANGGTAEIVENTLTLTNMTPGDEVTFDIRIENNSTVAVQYRTLLAVSENDGLFSGLNVTVDGTAFTNSFQSGWASLAVGSADIIVPVEVVLPSTAGNEYQEKSAKLNFTVSAVQGNAETVDIDPAIDTLLNEGNTTVNIPAGTLEEGQIVKLKVSDNATVPTAVATIDNTVICASDISFIDVDGNEFAMPEADYTVTMDIGTDLDATKLAIYHNEEKVEPISYNASTGIVTFTTDSFSPFTAVYEGIGTIDSVEDLVELRDSVNAGDTKEGNVYTLTEGINLNGEWTTINNFAGTFDGNGKTISNMNANLFGTVSGTVKNLNVENVTANNTSKGGANGFIGTVAEGGLVDNCKVSDVTITWADTVRDVTDCWGGVISRINAGATVQNSEFNNIKVQSSGKMKRTGAVFAEVTGTISGCTIDGVTLIAADDYSGYGYLQQSGGVIADLYAGAEVTDCTLNDVVITADEAFNTAGIFGKAYGGAKIDGITVNGLTMTIGNTVVNYAVLQNVAGFIAQVDHRANDPRLTINNCHINNLDMTLTSNGIAEAPSAGFIASLCGGTDIINCSVDGKITGVSNVVGIGGFIGDAGLYANIVVNITDCVADVTITAEDGVFVGGFVGYAGQYYRDNAHTLNFTNCEATGSFYGAKDTNEAEVITFTGCTVDGEAFAG